MGCCITWRILSLSKIQSRWKIHSFLINRNLHRRTSRGTRRITVSPHDPAMFEDRLVNEATIVQAHLDPEGGYLLRILRTLKNRLLMKILLRGVGRGFMAFLVANGLYGDIMYYHSGTSQWDRPFTHCGNITNRSLDRLRTDLIRVRISMLNIKQLDVL